MSLIRFAQSRDDAAAVGQAMLLAQALLDGPPGFGPQTFAYSSPLRHNDAAPRRPEPFGAAFGIGGVGVFADRGSLRPVILQYSPQDSFEPRMLHESADLEYAMRSAIPGGISAVPDAIVLPISEPELLAAPGDAVSSAFNGTAGVQLNWGPGLDGLLTAGHVCKSTTNAASVAGTKGSVVLALDPTNHGGLVEADVSIIQLASAVPAASCITTTATAMAGDTVTVSNRMGKSVSTKVMGQLQWLWIPSSKCTCGHVYMTTQNVTVAGDSGAPVRKGSDLVGHVIAGSPGMTTYIQEIDYQLQEIRAQATFSAAKL